VTRPVLAALCLCAAGCPKDPPPPSCTLPFAGDRDAGLEIQPLLDVPSDGGAQLMPLQDGDVVEIYPPPQGGFVFFPTARVRNLDPCNTAQEAGLYDPATGDLVGGRSRRSSNLVDEGTGWWVARDLTGFSAVPNVAACPDQSGIGVLAGRTLELRVTITDQEMRTATRSFMVTLDCPPGPCQSLCQCTCGPAYVLGKCGADGGMGDGGPTCMRQ
jgi:hypothetical protein